MSLFGIEVDIPGFEAIDTTYEYYIRGCVGVGELDEVLLSTVLPIVAEVSGKTTESIPVYSDPVL